MNEGLAAALDIVEALLARQAQALSEGDADALRAAAERLQQCLGQLTRSAGRQTLPRASRARIIELSQRLRASQSTLVRRQLDVDSALNALGASVPALQELQARRVYGAGGVLGAPACRSRGFERV